MLYSIRLFGIVNRVTGENMEPGKHKFLCHVMEAETTGSKVGSSSSPSYGLATLYSLIDLSVKQLLASKVSELPNRII